MGCGDKVSLNRLLLEDPYIGLHIGRRAYLSGEFCEDRGATDFLEGILLTQFLADGDNIDRGV